MTPFNDNAAWINKSGNLTLGMPVDDSAGHATYGWAKNDVTLLVPATSIVSDTLPALTYATGDIPIRALAASTTHKVTIPLPHWFIRTTTVPSGLNSAGVSSTPKGILVKSLALFYRVNTNNLTSFSTMAINTTPLAAGTGLPTVTELASTLAGNTVTQAANVYAAVSSVTTVAFFNTADTLIWGLATIVTPGSCTCDILGASWRVAYAMY